MLLPDLDPPRQREFQGFADEMPPVAQRLQRVLVNLVAGHHPQDKTGPVAILQDCLIDQPEDLGRHQRLAPTRRYFQIKVGKVFAEAVLAFAIVTDEGELILDGVPGVQGSVLVPFRLFVGEFFQVPANGLD